MKRNWAKSTGVTLTAKLFGQTDRRRRRREHGLSSDDDSSSSSESDNEKKHRDKGGVELMITGKPVIHKVRGAASRARGRFRSGHIESPELTPQNEEAPSRFSIGRPGSSLSWRFRATTATPPPEAALKAPAPSASAEVPSRTSVDGLSAVPERPKSRMRHTLNPELLVVDEEGHATNRPRAPMQSRLADPACLWSAASTVILPAASTPALLAAQATIQLRNSPSKSM